ncbi:1-phosphofructokinase [Pasteurella multocida]|uniref:1-phosphofructokinase n=1 Tax=Pasteurella multocida TaxID=747 RepID=UPI001118AD46|nr:1-phosphofructokinase [Pasteurella multocida]MDY0631559.1 1-phosphofructokinase [Pasteurella multocida]QDA12829.1 1-phosphofructokinase [Pasteurella multocida subsp. multocida]
MTKVLTITLNSAYDLVGHLPHLTRGAVNQVDSLGLYPAGKGINIGKVLHDLGVEVALTGFLGQENQTGFQQLFSRLGLTDHFHRITGATRINVKLTESDGVVTDLNFQGYHVSKADWQTFVDFSLQQCQTFDVIAVCGSLPRGISVNDFAAWLSQLNKNNIKLILDTSQQAFTSGIQAKPWLVKPNRDELASWYGSPLTTQQDIILAATQLQRQGIPHVVVSMGEDGAIWLNENTVLHAQPPQDTPIVSTVGAGDTMVAGLIYGMLNAYSAEKTLAFETALSSLAVSQSNVGITDLTLLNPILEKINITFI